MTEISLEKRSSTKRRSLFSKLIRIVLFLSSAFSIAITLLIILSVLFESVSFFSKVSILDFLTGTKWSPQGAETGDHGSNSNSDSFGAIPVFLGTLLITIVAMVVAIPLGIYSAIYLSEYASKKFRRYAKPILEILAGIPTVVYGYFAVISVAPFISGIGDKLGLEIASESALAAGFIMGIMIIPFILSLSDDVINAVPQNLRECSLAIGATKAETITKVILPAAFPGLVSAVLLGISRAIGETMIVVMVTGSNANLTFNPLEQVTTVTVQIVTLLVGDQEFDSAKTLAAFALGLFLIITTLILNIVALKVSDKYKEQYV